MRKAIAFTIFLLILSGCAMSVPRDSFIDYAIEKDMGTAAIEEYPEYAYCFGMDKYEAADEISRMWRMSVREVSETIPEEVSSKDMAGYTAIMSARLDDRFWDMNKDNYLPDYLSPSEVRRCKQIVKK